MSDNPTSGLLGGSVGISDSHNLYRLNPHANLNVPDLLRFVVVLGPTSSVIDILTFALNWFYYGVKTADNEEAVRLTQTHWFLQGRSRAALSPALSTGAMMVIGFAITWIPPIQRALNFAQPSPTFVGFLVAEREAHTPISVRLLSCDIGP
ncbi:hypothetical protein E4U46_002199 [Claviceps purpurea]|nr:hypothetical protein E4U46_002199 [Claviceps purpurea]